MKLNILFLSQDDRMVLEFIGYSIQESLGDVTIGILEAQTKEEAVEILEFNSVDLIIADMNIDTIQSYKFYDSLQEELFKFKDIPFVFLSSDPEDQEIAILKGLQNFFLKPLENILKDTKVEKEKQLVNLPFIDGEYEHEIHQQTLEEILDCAKDIDAIIEDDGDLEKIKLQTAKIEKHIEQLMGSGII
jgi:CheY-like chemotaxis protein